MSRKKQRSKLSEQDRIEIRELYATNPKKFNKYRLAIQYGVSWAAIHYTVDEPARLRNLELSKQRNKQARRERAGE